MVKRTSSTSPALRIFRLQSLIHQGLLNSEDWLLASHPMISFTNLKVLWILAPKTPWLQMPTLSTITTSCWEALLWRTQSGCMGWWSIQVTIPVSWGIRAKPALSSANLKFKQTDKSSTYSCSRSSFAQLAQLLTNYGLWESAIPTINILHLVSPKLLRLITSQKLL